MVTYRQDRILSGRGPKPPQFAHGLRGLAVDRDDALYAVGDSRVEVFDPDGNPLRRWPTGQAGYSVAAADDGSVWVGQAGQVEIFEPDGQLRDAWQDPWHLGLVTAVGFAGDDVFFADAQARCIRRYDRQGTLLGNIGDKHRKGGFHIPNGVVDFAVDAEGILHVANPGMHRVEHYTADGELLGHFGRFDGIDPAGFPGCCNPTNVALAGDGRVAVTEKAGPRAKIYDRDGQLLAVVATEEAFDPAAKNMDLAVDSRGRIYVADTIRFQICVFEPLASSADAPTAAAVREEVAS